MARLLNQYCSDKSSELNYKFGIINSTFCLGKIGLEEGRINYAINQFETVNERNFFFHRAVEESYVKILSYRLVGKEKKAYELAYTAINKYKNLIYISPNVGLIYLQATLVSIELGQLDQANKFSNEFSDIVGDSNKRDLISLVNLTKALLLKNNKNLRDTIKAQDILYNILSESTSVNFDTRGEATRHLCEILIQEYELYENIEVLDEAYRLISELDKIAEEQKLIRVRYEIGLLQSKILLLQGKLEKSRTFLEELLNRAISQNLVHFEKRIKIDIKMIENNFQKWMDLINNNQSLKGIIEESNLKNYLTTVKQYVDDL